MLLNDSNKIGGILRTEVAFMKKFTMQKLPLSHKLNTSGTVFSEAHTRFTKLYCRNSRQANECEEL